MPAWPWFVTTEALAFFPCAKSEDGFPALARGARTFSRAMWKRTCSRVELAFESLKSILLDSRFKGGGALWLVGGGLLLLAAVGARDKSFKTGRAKMRGARQAMGVPNASPCASGVRERGCTQPGE